MKFENSFLAVLKEIRDKISLISGIGGSVGNISVNFEGITQIKGDKGEQGIQGIQGPQGIQGIQGFNGLDGKSAYQIWLNNGHVGTEQQFIEYLRDSNSLIGIGQTWQDVKSSRVSGTIYTNTTGKPIIVSVTSSIVGSGTTVECYVNSVLVAKSSFGVSGLFGSGTGMTFIVPAGSTYSCTVNAVALWSELR